MTRSSKIKFALALFFFLFAVGVFTTLFIYINNKNQVALTRMDDWHKEEDRRANIETMEKFLASKSAASLELDKHFVKSTDIVSFLDLIERLAPKVGSSAEVTLVDVAKDGTGLYVEVKSKGSFESLYRFLSLLENAPYILEITSMSMRAPGASEGGPWDATFKLKLVSFI